MDGTGDAEVIAGSIGAPHRFGEIFERHYDTVFRYASSRVGPDVGAEVAAEVFLRAFASRHRFDADASSARPWLFGIAVNVLRGHYRQTARGRRALIAAVGRAASEQVAWSEDADSRVDAAATRERLAAGLAAMGTKMRETLLLHTLADLTYQEVAEALGIPVGTVRSRLSRARATLKEALGDADDPVAGRGERDDG